MQEIIDSIVSRLEGEHLSPGSEPAATSPLERYAIRAKHQMHASSVASGPIAHDGPSSSSAHNGFSLSLKRLYFGNNLTPMEKSHAIEKLRRLLPECYVPGISRSNALHPPIVVVQSPDQLAHVQQQDPGFAALCQGFGADEVNAALIAAHAANTKSKQDDRILTMVLSASEKFRRQVGCDSVRFSRIDSQSALACVRALSLSAVHFCNIRNGIWKGNKIVICDAPNPGDMSVPCILSDSESGGVTLYIHRGADVRSVINFVRSESYSMRLASERKELLSELSDRIGWESVYASCNLDERIFEHGNGHLSRGHLEAQVDSLAAVAVHMRTNFVRLPSEKYRMRMRVVIGPSSPFEDAPGRITVALPSKFEVVDFLRTLDAAARRSKTKRR